MTRIKQYDPNFIGPLQKEDVLLQTQNTQLVYNDPNNTEIFNLIGNKDPKIFQNTISDKVTVATTILTHGIDSIYNFTFTKVKNAFQEENKGNEWDQILNVLNNYSLYTKQFEADEKKIVKYLKDGKKILLSVTQFENSNNSEYIVLSGIDKDGNIIVSSPKSSSFSINTEMEHTKFSIDEIMTMVNSSSTKASVISTTKLETIGESLVSIAKSELGKPHGIESGGNNRVLYNNYSGEFWCAYFVSWCSKQAGIIDDKVPFFTYTGNGEAWFKEKGKWENNNYTPNPGDIVFFPNHVGIVDYVDDLGKIHTIEGNYSDKVSEVTRSKSEIRGYGVIDD